MVEKDKLPSHLRNAPGKFDYLKIAYEPEPDPNAVKSLGAINSWGDDLKKYPKQYRFCRRKRKKNPHLLIVSKKGTCYTEYECEKCKIKWTEDSSG